MTRIGILGGTGAQGSGLALRWARAGHQVIIGSRSTARAALVAGELSTQCGVAITGLDNLAAAASCEVAVLSVPYSWLQDVLRTVRTELVGKVLLSVVVPLRPPRVDQVWQPAAGSAAREAQDLLGAATPVITAFQNVAAGQLSDLTHPIESDILVCGDDPAGKAVALQLVSDAGCRGLDAGPLDNACVVEGLTAILIGLNKRYRRAREVGIRITGVET